MTTTRPGPRDPAYADRVTRELREIKPLDLPLTPFALAGLALWAVAGLVLLPFQDSLEAQGRGDWVWVCVAGFLVGLPGTLHMMRRDRRRKHAPDPADPADGPAQPWP